MHIRMIMHIIIAVVLGLFILWCLRGSGVHGPSQGNPHIIKVVRPMMPDLSENPQKVSLPINTILEQAMAPEAIQQPIPMTTPSMNTVPDLQTQYNPSVEAISSDTNGLSKDDIQEAVPMTQDAPAKTPPPLTNYNASDEYTSISKLYQPDKFMDQLRGMDMSSKDVPAGRQYDERFSAILKSAR